MIDLDCPECGEIDSLRIKVEYETESSSYMANIEEQACECKLTDTQIESVCEDATERWTESED